MSSKERIHSERRKLKAQYGLLFDQVSAALFEEDLIGINFGGNTDEYDPETGTILPRLQEAKNVSEVQAILHEEFIKWFGVPNAGAQKAYASLATKVWSLWQSFRLQQLNGK